MVTIYEKTNVNVKREEGELAILNMFRHPRFEGWTVFEEPHINSMKPDFVAFHPEKGILIIEVKDYDLYSDTYRSGGYVVGTNGKLIKKNPVQQVEHYKNSILKNELRSSVDFAEEFENYYGCIETIVYFHKANIQGANDFCGFPKHTKVWTNEHIQQIMSGANLFGSAYPYALKVQHSNYAKNGMLQRLTEELSHVLQYADYNLERTEPVILDRKQNGLANLKCKKTTLYKGVAGSGKTLMLAEKAIQSAEMNQKVLILTYNITLRHYIRDLLSQQCPQQSRVEMKKNISILHFHDFLKNIFNEAAIEYPAVNDGEDFTTEWIAKINKDIFAGGIKSNFLYDSIIIDEGQDFDENWLLFLRQLYTKKGEFAVFADTAQDLYNRGSWIEDESFLKEFDMKRHTIRQSYRLPKKIVEKIETAKALLQMSGETIEIAKINEQGSLLEHCEFKTMQANSLTHKINAISTYVNQLKARNVVEDITILTTNENTGAEIVKYFNKHGERTSHVYDLARNRDLDSRRYEKWKFQGGTGRLKVCSYHSYKGWETPNILLVLDDPSTNYDSEGNIIVNDNESIDSIKKALFISLSRIKPKRMDGSFNFVCLNYTTIYNDQIASLSD